MKKEDGTVKYSKLGGFKDAKTAEESGTCMDRSMYNISSAIA